jgi:hypothetical protein
VASSARIRSASGLPISVSNWTASRQHAAAGGEVLGGRGGLVVGGVQARVGAHPHDLAVLVT